MNVFRKIILIFFIIIFTTTNAFAIEDIQKGSVLTLEDCIKIALKNSPLLKQNKYNYEIAGHNVTIAKAAYFPKLGIGTGYNVATSSSDVNSTNSNAYNLDASLSMLIFNFGKTNANINMQKFNKINAYYTFTGNVLITTIKVRTNYYGVMAARAAVDINKAYVQINERNYQRTKAYFDQGIKSKIDLVNAEVNLSDAKVALLEAEKVYKNAFVELNNSMYIAFAPEYEITPIANFKLADSLYIINLDELDRNADLSVPPVNVDNATLTASAEKTDILADFKLDPYPYTFEESIDIAYKNRSTIKAYSATVDAMKESLKYVKREYLPDLTASTGYGFNNNYMTNSFNVGVRLSSNVNILSKKHEIDNAKLQVMLAENELAKLKQDIYFDVKSAYIHMVDLEKQIPLLAVKVRQSLENFELADGRYSVGLGDYIELQDAKVKYNNAQHTYVEAIYKYEVARATLEELIALPQKVTIKIEDVK